MNTKHFPIFIKLNYPQIVISDEEAISVAEMFKKYLLDKFKDDKAKLEPIWDIEPMNAIMRSNHPLFTNGYHPAFILHFHEFIKQNI